MKLFKTQYRIVKNYNGFYEVQSRDIGSLFLCWYYYSHSRDLESAKRTVKEAREYQNFKKEVIKF